MFIMSRPTTHELVPWLSKDYSSIYTYLLWSTQCEHTMMISILILSLVSVVDAIGVPVNATTHTFIFMSINHFSFQHVTFLVQDANMILNHIYYRSQIHAFSETGGCAEFVQWTQHKRAQFWFVRYDIHWSPYKPANNLLQTSQLPLHQFQNEHH